MDLGTAGSFIGVMLGFGAHGWTDDRTLYALSTNAIPLAALALCATPLPRKAFMHLAQKGKRGDAIAVSAAYGMLLALSTAYLVTATYNPFLYFRF
jgi:alginate O-acetyltransferase complex protein AlgI